MYKSFVSLGRYIPNYFILFVAMVNGIVSLISTEREIKETIPFTIATKRINC